MRPSSFTLLFLVVACLAFPLSAGEEERGGEFGFMVGGLHPDDDLVVGSRNIEPTVGLRGGSVFSQYLGWFVDAIYSDIDSNSTSGDVEQIAARTGLDFLFPPGKGTRWFVSLGAGWFDFDPQRGRGFDGAFSSFSFGQRIYAGERTNVRWELRADHGLDDDLRGERVTQALGLIGFTFGPQRSQVDADGDGVSDRKDRCPGTPRGAVVDKQGCPTDADADGVFDGLDRCPETAKGWPADPRGCPKDSDGDGVPDGLDRCPDTPEGAEVDANGCPSDGDGDGVFDGPDRCPDTPAFAQVGADGCPMDSDGDGVFDGLDRCPATPRGARVNERGCSLDSDGDGVADSVDRCPDTPAGVSVDAQGCPKAAPLFQEERSRLILEGVTFQTNRAALTAKAKEILDEVALSLMDWPETRVEIGGHSDSPGPEAHNLRLSTQRAESVKSYLQSKGVAVDRLVSKGYGESKPIGDNATAEGRARNRRVELKKLD